MSPGNLYRYFPSKDALVAGLCERDRVGLAQEFADGARTPAAISSPPSAISAAATSRTARQSRQGEALPGNLGRGGAQPRDRRAADRFRPQPSRSSWSRPSRAPSSRGRSIRTSTYARRRLDHRQARRRAFRAARRRCGAFDAEREIAEVFAVIGALLKGAIKIPGRFGPLQFRIDAGEHVMMFSRILAVILVVAATLWIGSGVFGRTEAPTKTADDGRASPVAQPLFQVATSPRAAEQHARKLVAFRPHRGRRPRERHRAHRPARSSSSRCSRGDRVKRGRRHRHLVRRGARGAGRRGRGAWSRRSADRTSRPSCS